MSLTVSVVIATLNRPDYVRRCIECLLSQDPPPEQIVVVDASPDDRTAEAVAKFPGVVYLRNDKGRGNTPRSRNMGIKATTGEIIAFVDDDAMAHPAWLKNLVETYSDPMIGAVAGRALDNRPGEETDGVHQIGRLKPNGILCAHFAADPGKIIDVDHMLGANMSFRREVVAKLGGFRDDVPAGPSGICEETDMCVRVKKLGYRILFNPLACVDHLAAPQAKGRRFDLRYSYYHRRNNFIMFVRNFGFRAIVWRYLGVVTGHTLKEFISKIGGAFSRLAVSIAEVFMGFLIGARLWIQQRRDPIRKNADADEIRRALSNPVAAESPLPRVAPETRPAPPESMAIKADKGANS